MSDLDGAIPLVRDEVSPVPEGLTNDHVGAFYQSVLRLIEARSMYLVGAALAVKYPDEDSFEELLGSPTFVDAIDAFTSVKDDLIAAGTEDLRGAVATHSTRAYEALEVLCELLGIPPEDLISVLVR